MHQLYLGVDVAKDRLDVFHPQRGASQIDNTAATIRTFVRTARCEGLGVVFEATGGYDRALREALAAADVPFSRLNPRQARDFARASGLLAKPDRGNARMLSEFGPRMQPPPTPAIPEMCAQLQALATRRRQLVEARKEEMTGLAQTADPVARDPKLTKVSRRRQSVPGVGPIVAPPPDRGPAGTRKPLSQAHRGAGGPCTHRAGQRQAARSAQHSRRQGHECAACSTSPPFTPRATPKPSAPSGPD